MDIEQFSLENEIDKDEIPEYMERRLKRKPPSRYNLKLIVLGIFIGIFLIEIIIGTLVFNFLVVPLCVLFLMEVILGACLEKMVIEVMGVVAIIQLIAGFLSGKFLMMFFCVFIFVTTVGVIRILRDDRIQ